jgi:DNA-binding CsgD family transcriptional regulator
MDRRAVFVAQYVKETRGGDRPGGAAFALPEEMLAERGISPREREVLDLILAGLGNQEIADRLFVSLPTVKSHVRNIFRKFGVGGRFELVRFVNGANAVPPPGR